MCTVDSQIFDRQEMCSDGGGAGDGITGVGKIRHTISFPEFWRGRGSWSPGCCIAANIKLGLGEHSGQLQVFPSGRGESNEEEEETSADESVKRSLGCCIAANIKLGLGEHSGRGESNEQEDTSADESKEDEEACDDESNEGDNDCTDEENNEETSAAAVLVLVNTSDSDLIIDGEGSLRAGPEFLFHFVMKNTRVAKSGAVDLLHLVEKNNCTWEGGSIVVKLELSAKEFFEEEKPHPEVAATECTLLESLAEVNENASKVSSMMAGLRDQVMEGMESIQDILLETPLRKEMTDIRKDLRLMKSELFDLINAKMNILDHRGIQEKEIVQEVSAVMKGLVKGVEESNKRVHVQVFDSIREMKEEVEIGFQRDWRRGATASDANTLSAISEVKLQLEMLQDSVLAAVSSPPPPHRAVYPECPYCMEEFIPPAEILQCVSGHLICPSCRAKPAIRDCPSCHQQFAGRNRGLEAYSLRLREG